MNDDARKAAILRERARKLRERVDDVAPRRVRAHVVVVEAGREAYGLPVASVREIVKATPIAPMPGLPAFLPGVAAVRGQLLSVVDLAEMNGRGRTGSGAFFAVLESARGAIALRIESVLGLRDVFDDEIAEALTHDSGDQAYVEAYTRDFVGLVHVERMLESERLVVGAHDAGGPSGRGRSS